MSTFEKFLKWVLGLLVAGLLVLIIVIPLPALRLDLIHPSLPAIPLNTSPLTRVSIIGEIAHNVIGGKLSSQNAFNPDPTDPLAGAINEDSAEVLYVTSQSPAAQDPSPTVTASPIPALTVPSTLTALPTLTPAATLTSTHSPSEAVPTVTRSFETTYYVAPNGNDSAPGTSSQPWKTIQHAAESVSPGDTVIVLAGNYSERVFVNRSGASGAPITFKAQGTVTMRGFTIDADYITLSGFDISNTPDSWANGWGIYLEGSHCTIIENYVHFATRGGIALYTAPGEFSQTSNCIVRDNRLYRNAMTGLSVRGRNHLVEGNEIWGTIQYHPNWNNPPNWADADGIRFHGSGHTIRGNYIHDISLQDPENIDPHIDCFQTWSDAESEAARDITLEQNRCENLNVGMYAFMLEDASHLIIRNNIIQAFAGVNTGGGGNSHLTIVNNVFAGDLALSSSAQSTGIELKNAPDAAIKNNIFYNFRGQALAISGNSNQGLDVGNNCAYRSDGEPVTGSPYATDLWNVNPLFASPGTGDFHLQTGSPLIDAGQSLASVSNDFSSTSRPQGPGYDIGAFERSP